MKLVAVVAEGNVPRTAVPGYGALGMIRDDLRCWVTPTLDFVGVIPKDWNAWRSSHEWTSNVSCFRAGRLPARSNELDAKHGLHAANARLGPNGSESCQDA